MPTRARRVDAALAVGLFALTLVVLALTGGLSPTSVAVAAAFTLPLAARRRWPLPVLVVVVGGVALLIVADVDVGFMVVPAVAIASYSGGRQLDPPLSHVAGALAIGWLWLPYLPGRSTPLEEVVVGTMIYGGAWWIGRTLRIREQHVERLAEQAERAKRERRESEERAAEAERARIARELHDIVAHSISVISIQAESVRRRLGPGQKREADRLRDIETSARHAMAELRRLVGVLRADADSVPLAPQPGLDQLPRLVERTQAAGLPVELRIEGESEPLPPGVDLAAYRIVQEALTNALRHAGPTTASVTIERSAMEIRVLVEDSGRGANGVVPGGGLTGMRERVTLYGGTLTAREREEGGFRVEATLPLRAGAAA